MKNAPLLIADIGGTNARFALASGDQPYFVQAQTFQCIDFDTIETAIESYLNAHNLEQVSGICFAVAGTIIDGNIDFTNNHWVLKTSALQARFNVKTVKLLNDFAAIAYSLPKMRSIDVANIGGDWPQLTEEDYTVAVLGPGSGLGIAGLRKDGDNLTPLITEGGHSGFAAENELQLEVLKVLHKKFDRVSVERVLSGPGLMNIHEALCEIHGKENTGLSASDIAISGSQARGDICHESMDLFFEILGQAAGDIALILGAHQGVYIGGGIVQRYPEFLEQSKFRQGFENKGRYQELMQSIPSWLIKRKNPGLVGCSSYALKHSSS